jgi:hypothetical protein
MITISSVTIGLTGANPFINLHAKQGNVQYCTPKFFSLTFSHPIIQPVQEQVKKAPSKQVMNFPPKTKFLPSERRRKKSSKTRNSGPGKTHRPSRQILKVMVG